MRENIRFHDGYVTNNYLSDVISQYNIYRKNTLIIASPEFQFNLTHRENLYVCDKNSTLLLKFFNKIDDDCDWELLNEVRKNTTRANDINDRI